MSDISHYVPTLINSRIPQTNTYNHHIAYNDVDTRKGSTVSLQLLQLRNPYTNIGNVKIVIQGDEENPLIYHFADDTSTQTYVNLRQAFNLEIGDKLQIAWNSEKRQFILFPGSGGNIICDLSFSGNYMQLFGYTVYDENYNPSTDDEMYSNPIHLELTADTFYRLSQHNLYAVDYVKLKCPQLDGALIVQKGSTNTQERGVMMLMMQSQTTQFFNRDRAYVYTVKDFNNLDFYLLDQNNNPYDFGVWYLQVIVENFNECVCVASHQKQLAFFYQTSNDQICDFNTYQFEYIALVQVTLDIEKFIQDYPLAGQQEMLDCYVTLLTNVKGFWDGKKNVLAVVNVWDTQQGNSTNFQQFVWQQINTGQTQAQLQVQIRGDELNKLNVMNTTIIPPTLYMLYLK